MVIYVQVRYTDLGDYVWVVFVLYVIERGGEGAH